MTDGLRGALRWRRVHTGFALLLALAVAAFVVLPALGLVLALLGLVLFVAARAGRRRPEEKR